MEVLSNVQDGEPDATFVVRGKVQCKHLVNLKDPWGIIRHNAGIDDVRIHDLRHCFASIGAMSGMSLPMIGALLGQKEIATTQRYAHLSDNPVRSASDRIGNRIRDLLTPSEFEGVSSKGQAGE